MFDKRCRTDLERGLRPVGSSLGKVGITANQLTAVGIVISVVAALAVPTLVAPPTAELPREVTNNVPARRLVVPL